MTQYEIYTFILCLIVLIALTSLFVALLASIVKLSMRLIRHGAEDQTILQEYRQQDKKRKLTLTDVLSALFSLIVCAAMILAFSFSLYLNVTENKAANGVPSLKVVRSSSMSFVNEKNKNLKQDNIDNQLQIFDLIITEKLPDEFDLEIYDIVVYEQDGNLIIHRIVGIEEPNENHPQERYFSLQGDAVQYKDKFPVLYSQMRGIYRGARIPFIGSFIMFMQSPAGWLCILLILFALITTPLVERKINQEKATRLETLLGRSRRLSSTRTSLTMIRRSLLSLYFCPLSVLS